MTSFMILLEGFGWSALSLLYLAKISVSSLWIWGLCIQVMLRTPRACDEIRAYLKFLRNKVVKFLEEFGFTSHDQIELV
jgi:hypothetical protein